MNMAMARPETLISVRGLTVDFGGPPILENVDLDIYRGEIMAIVGGSGTGKSVLMRSILGLVRRQAGTVQAFGSPITDMGSEGRLESRWGVLFQQGALFSSLTVSQNVAVPIREYLDLPQSDRVGWP
jgi:phospholipid/cholesterol/gamma-HCH transport system ATP-binding protein